MAIQEGALIDNSDITSTTSGILKFIKDACVAARTAGSNITDPLLSQATADVIGANKIITIYNLNVLINKYNELMLLANNKDSSNVKTLVKGESSIGADDGDIIDDQLWIDIKNNLLGNVTLGIPQIQFGIPIGSIYIVGVTSMKVNSSTSLKLMKMMDGGVATQLTSTTAYPINWAIVIPSGENALDYGSISPIKGTTSTYKSAAELSSNVIAKIQATWKDPSTNQNVTTYHEINVKTGNIIGYELKEITRDPIMHHQLSSIGNSYNLGIFAYVQVKATSTSAYTTTSDYNIRYSNTILFVEFPTEVYGCKVYFGSGVNSFTIDRVGRSFPMAALSVGVKLTSTSTDYTTVQDGSFYVDHISGTSIKISFPTQNNYYGLQASLLTETKTTSMLENSKDLYYIIWATPQTTDEPKYVYTPTSDPTFTKVSETGTLNKPNFEYIYNYPGYEGSTVAKVSYITVKSCISLDMNISFSSLKLFTNGVLITTHKIEDVVNIINTTEVTGISIETTPLTITVNNVKGIYESTTTPSTITFPCKLTFNDPETGTNFTRITTVDDGITWSIQSGRGTIDSVTGLYTAPNDVIGTVYENVSVKAQYGNIYDVLTFAIFNNASMAPISISVESLTGVTEFIEGSGTNLYYLVKAKPVDSSEIEYVVEIPTTKVTLSSVSGNCSVTGTKSLITDYQGYEGQPIIKISDIVVGSGGEYGLLNISFQHPTDSALVCSASTVKVFNSSEPKSVVILPGSLVSISGDLGIYESKDGVINRTTFTARITLQDDSVFDKNADNSMTWSIFNDPTGLATIDQTGLFTAPEVQTTTDITIKAVYESITNVTQTGTYEFKVFNIAQLTSISFADNDMGLPSTFNVLENTELQLYAFANYNDGTVVEITNDEDAVWGIASNPDSLTGLSIVGGLFHVENIAFDSTPIIMCTYKGIIKDPLNNTLPRIQTVTVRNILDIQLSNGTSLYVSPTSINEGAIYPIVVKSLLSNNETKNITSGCTFTLLNPTNGAVVQPSLTKYPFCTFGAPGELIVGTFTDDQVVKLKVDYKTHSKILTFNLIDLNYLLSIEITGGKAELIENDYTTFGVAAMLDDLETYTPTTGITWSISSYGTISSSYIGIDQTGKLTTGNLPLNANSNITIRASLTRKGITKIATKTVKVYDAFTGNEVLTDLVIKQTDGDSIFYLGNTTSKFSVFGTFTENTKSVTKPLIVNNWQLTHQNVNSYSSISSAGSLTLDDICDKYNRYVYLSPYVSNGKDCTTFSHFKTSFSYTYKTVTKTSEYYGQLMKTTNLRNGYIDNMGSLCIDISSIYSTTYKKYITADPIQFTYPDGIAVDYSSYLDTNCFVREPNPNITLHADNNAVYYTTSENTYTKQIAFGFTNPITYSNSIPFFVEFFDSVSKNKIPFPGSGSPACYVVINVYGSLQNRSVSLSLISDNIYKIDGLIDGDLIKYLNFGYNVNPLGIRLSRNYIVMPGVYVDEFYINNFSCPNRQQYAYSNMDPGGTVILPLNFSGYCEIEVLEDNTTFNIYNDFSASWVTNGLGYDKYKYNGTNYVHDYYNNNGSFDVITTNVNAISPFNTMTAQTFFSKGTIFGVVFAGGYTKDGNLYRNGTCVFPGNSIGRTIFGDVYYNNNISIKVGSGKVKVVLSPPFKYSVTGDNIRSLFAKPQ